MKKSVYIYYLLFLVFMLGVQKSAFSQVVAEDEKPYEFATQMPEYPGGSEAMTEFILNNLAYPEAEKKAHIQGTITMQFIVEKNGSLSNIIAIKSVSKGANLEKEAERVIKLMPKWKPGIQDGHNVRVYKNVPFYFVLAPKKTKKHHK